MNRFQTRVRAYSWWRASGREDKLAIIMLNRLAYYARSIPTIARGVANLDALPRSLLGLNPIIRLRGGPQLRVGSLMDVWIAKETILDRDYERVGTSILDGWTILDVGAALGDFAVYVGLAHPTARVIAFEPFTESFARLRENIELNHLKNVTAVPRAISNNGGMISLAKTGSAVQHTITKSTLSGHASESLRVPALTLNDALDDHEVNRCDFLKMDCEGAEFEILLNAPISATDRIDRICLEYHDGFTSQDHTALVRHLENRGYEVTCTPNPVHAHLGFLYARKAIINKL